MWLQAYTDGASGLWISDGTPGVETRLATRYYESVPAPRFLQGRMWFGGDSPEYGGELWSSDGTLGGTGMVRDINDVGTGSLNPSYLSPIGHRMAIFDHGELWVSDGSSGGTFKVPGPEFDRLAPFYGSDAQLGERIYFTARRPETKTEIWWSDGEQIEQLTNITSDEATPRFPDLESTGRHVVFVSGDREIVELWGTDGEEVVRLVRMERKSKVSGPGISAVADIETLGEEAIVFMGWNFHDYEQVEEMWRTDGTAAGTRRIAAVRRPPSSPCTAVGRHVFFLQEGEQEADPLELWRTDGSEAGTVRVATLPGKITSVSDLRALRDQWLIRGRCTRLGAPATVMGSRRVLRGSPFGRRA